MVSVQKTMKKSNEYDWRFEKMKRSKTKTHASLEDYRFHNPPMKKKGAPAIERQVHTAKSRKRSIFVQTMQTSRPTEQIGNAKIEKTMQVSSCCCARETVVVGRRGRC
jgi:hypothetical protein